MLISVVTMTLTDKPTFCLFLRGLTGILGCVTSSPPTKTK